MYVSNFIWISNKNLLIVFLTFQCLGTLDTILLSKKRKKPLKDDNLATIVEPTTYEDAIKKYGVELRIEKVCNNRYKNQFTQRRGAKRRYFLSCDTIELFTIIHFSEGVDMSA